MPEVFPMSYVSGLYPAFTLLYGRSALRRWRPYRLSDAMEQDTVLAAQNFVEAKDWTDIY